ncbi:peptidase C1B, bleomycin hydrolase [Kockovaella imperatae]|uniref:Cysteine proteinase 1, mitochondrial n=1 Tax=Kockovaella imperatae TaxID=4999 RepID=A0A1Y1UAB7_9TREE|nr:peptidase C1B, bleomycin hydrolase [Kockovaella imperatae]ORX34978.1 peptidase C1B, bleomycin hydrolase [Kockovaella imperatae]
MGSQPSKPVQSTSTPITMYDEKKAATLSFQTKGDDTVGWASVPVDSLAEWSSEFDSSPTLQLSRLILTNADPVTSLTSRKALIHDNKVFNLQLKGLGAKNEYPGPRVNQGSSGRCWLFATCNVLRYNVMEQLKIEDFELAQAYLFFYDKLEKANHYLENMIELADEPNDSRTVSFLNREPLGDGGQWDMAVNILEKYGCVPKTIYPESFSSMASGKLNNMILSKLREFAIVLREQAKTQSVSSLRKTKSEMMTQIYTTLSITLGAPPHPDEPFTWDYYDSENKFHHWRGSPKEFYAQFCQRKNMAPKDSFSLINDPRNKYEHLYTVERLGNVWGGRPVRYVNAPIEALEDAVVAGIKANTPLFFGCDSGKTGDRVSGVWDTELYDTKLAYGWSLQANKTQRLETGDSSMTHAMVITAVHLDESGRPLKYKIENSWSDQNGEKGWFMMTASWFREYVYQVVIPRSVADKRWTAVYDAGNPTVLKPWDPMVSPI